MSCRDREAALSGIPCGGILHPIGSRQPAWLLLVLQRRNFGRPHGFVEKVLRGITANSDQLGGDAHAYFFWSERANLESHRGMYVIEFLGSVSFFFQRLIYGNNFSLA